MENIIEFIRDNYAWFLTISIILLFGLIGYIVDTKRNDNDLMKKAEDELDEDKLKELMSESNNDGKSLSEMVSKSKNINPETKSVELVDNTIINNPSENDTNKVQ